MFGSHQRIVNKVPFSLFTMAVYPTADELAEMINFETAAIWANLKGEAGNLETALGSLLSEIDDLGKSLRDTSNVYV